MTKRRLLNKKAYEELLLLKKMTSAEKTHEYIISVQVDYDGKESFIIDQYSDDSLKELTGKIVGENYTAISKLFIENVIDHLH